MMSVKFPFDGDDDSHTPQHHHDVEILIFGRFDLFVQAGARITYPTSRLYLRIG